MLNRIIALALMALLCYGCAAPRSAGVKTGETLSLHGTVLKVQGTEAEIAVTYPEPEATADSFVAELAQKVIAKTIFVEGSRTEINGTPVVIQSIGKNFLTIKTAQTDVFAKGSSVSISVPKKTLAVADFEVINNPRNDVGRLLLESLTSELVESGQFIVLERTKLKSVLDEIRLSQSGLTAESSESMAGKIINADIVLTGTLAETGGDWTVNLRVLNTRTSQAIASITHKSPLFKPADPRDPSPLSEDFEGSAFPSWNIGFHKNGEDHFKVSIDPATGAENSAASMRVDFDFTHGNLDYFANASTYSRRDLTQFKGIEFYVKGTEGLNAYVNLLSSQPDDANKINNWIANFEIAPEWRKVRIPFDALSIGRSWIKDGATKFGAQAGDQLLRLNRIESVRIGLKGKHIPVAKGTFWLDRISFYH